MKPIWIIIYCLAEFVNGQHSIYPRYGTPYVKPMPMEENNRFGQAVLQYMTSIQRHQMSDQYQKPESDVPVPESFKRPEYEGSIPRPSQSQSFNDSQNTIVESDVPITNAPVLGNDNIVTSAEETTIPQAKIYKHIYVHAAPDEPEEIKTPKPMQHTPSQRPEKHYRILFIKAPSASVFEDEEIQMPPVPEQRTLVYVLLPKSTFGLKRLNLAYPKPKLSTPEVYFIRYKGQEDSEQKFIEKHKNLKVSETLISQDKDQSRRPKEMEVYDNNSSVSTKLDDKMNRALWK